VRLVTVTTDRQLLFRIVDLTAVDAVPELFRDSQVTIAAGRCNVRWTDGRPRVISGEFSVCRMAINTSGCHQKTTLHQPLPMNTHAVILQDLILFTSIQYGRLLSLTMALATEIRHILREDGRIEIVLLLRSVRAMAIRAIGGIRIPAGMLQAVLTTAVKLNHFCMAHGTINAAAFPTDRISILVHVGVALDTGTAAVGGMDHLVLVHVKRDHFTVDLLLELGIRMAGHAESIRKALLVKDAANLVRLMTVDTTGYLMGSLLPEFPPDHFQMDLFNLRMALHASTGDVVPVDR
jgi:hypothetical protein